MQGRHGPHGNRRISAPAMPGNGGLFRFLFGFCLTLLLYGASPVSVALTVPAGDLAPIGNPDGELDVADFLVLQRFILGTLTPTPEQRLIADVAPLGSPDGELNAGDFVVLMRAIHGQVSLPPVYLGPDAPVLNAASGITHANPYTLTGTAEAGSEVRLYLNGALHETTTASGPQGGFEFQIILRDGENQLYAVVVEVGEEGPASSLLTLDYVNDIPREQGGTLSENAVWTPGTVPTPYVITSTLTVAPGATLTLMPGTVLRFAAGATLDVAGALNVAGSAISPVVFTSDAPMPVPGDWAGLLIRSSAQNVRIDGAIIEYAASGMTIDGAQTHISNCTVRGFSKTWGHYGLGFINGAGGFVEDCMIDNTLAGPNNHSSSGIYVATGAQPELRRNTITGTGWGVSVEAGAPWLHGNTIENNYVGIELLGAASALINGLNVITNNSSVGIQYSGGFGWDIPGSIVKNNAIFNNQLNVYISGFRSSDEFEIDLTENWWGTTSPSVISSGIWDHKDVWGELTPVARLAPFLDAPGGQSVTAPFLNGRVGQDTVLGPAGTAHAVLGSFVVAPDITLTILPGTQIGLSSNAVVHVRGNLDIQGTTEHRVVLTSLNDVANLPPGWGLLIGDPAWKGVVAGASITEARFEGLFFATETVNGSQTDIHRSEFVNNHTAVRYDRSAHGSVLNSRIAGYKVGGATAGVRVMRDAYPLISTNTITGMDYGIDAAGANPLVQGNVVQGNTYGIRAGAGMQINAANSITGNDYGVYSSVGGVMVNNNNIYANGHNFYKTNPSSTNDATDNWWGTAVAAEVSAGIYSQTAGNVIYVPFLTGPIPLPPVIDAGIAVTNAANRVVTGRAEPGVQVRLYVNSVVQVTADTAQDGTFSANVLLSEGVNTLHAEAFNTTTTSSSSNIVQVTLDTVPPIIDLTAPINGEYVNAYPVFRGETNEPSTVSVAGQSVALTPDNRFSHGPVPLTEGINHIQVVATDRAGNVATQTVILVLDTIPPTDPDMSLVTFGALVGGQITVTGSPGAIDSGALVHLANARTGQTAVVTADGDGTFSVSIEAQSGDTLTLVATDSLGNQTAWAQETVPGAPPAFAILETDPPNGAVIANDRVTLSGRYQGAENTGIVIAGYVAQLEGDRFLVSGIHLAEGLNEIEIVATTPDGTVHSHVLSLTSTGAIPFSVQVSPDTGTAPLLATLTVFNETGMPIQLLQYDLDNDGAYELSYPDLNYSQVWIGLAYGAGTHKGRVRVTDYAGNSYVLPFGVVVTEPIGMQAQLRAQYQRMLTRLRSGNVQGALSLFADTSRERYEGIFDAIGGQVAAAVDGLGEIKAVTFGDGWAELLLVRGSEGNLQAYRINMIRSEDGVWRIEDM